VSVKEFEEKPTLKCCKEENCGMDECDKPCEQAQWEIDHRNVVKKCKTLTYPGQERFGKSNKLVIHLGEEQELYISAQAREILDWQCIDEPKFVASLVAMMKGPLNAYHTNEQRDYTMSARCVIVSKGVEGKNEMDSGYPYIKIEVREFTGLKNNGKDYNLPWRDAYPIITPEAILSIEAKNSRSE